MEVDSFRRLGDIRSKFHRVGGVLWWPSVLQWKWANAHDKQIRLVKRVLRGGILIEKKMSGLKGELKAVRMSFGGYLTLQIESLYRDTFDWTFSHTGEQ